MRILRSLLNIGTFTLIVVVPLIAWTGFYDGVEEPKMAVTLWAAILVICAWLTGCLSGKLHFWPQSSHIKVGASAYILLAASGCWAGLKIHLLEYTIFYGISTLLLLAWDNILNSPLMESLLTNSPDESEQDGLANQHKKEDQSVELSHLPQERTENNYQNIVTPQNSPNNYENRQMAAGNYIWTLIGWLSLAALLAGLYSCLQKITPLQLSIFGLTIGDPMGWNYPHLSQGRTISTFGNPNYSGVWFAAVLPLSLSWLLTRLTHKWAKAASFIAWLLCAVVIIITQTRAAWLGFGVGMIVWFLTMIVAYANKKAVIKVGLSALLGLTVLSALYIAYAERNLGSNNINQYTTTERIQSFKDLNDPSLQARLWFWQSAWHTALAFPFTGVGPYGQVNANLLDRSSEPMVTRPHGQLPTSTHSQFFHILATAGWPAFILYLISVALTLNSARQIENISLRAACLGATVSLWIAHIFTSFTVSSELLWFFVTASVSAVSSATHKKSEPDLDLNIPLMEMGGRTRLAAIIGTIIIFAATLAVLMDFASLRLGSMGNKYYQEAQQLRKNHNASIAEILLTYDQANACYEVASALSPAWMTWQYNLEISRVFTEINYQVLPVPDDKMLFKAVEYGSIAAAYAPDKTLPLTNLAYIFSRDPKNLPQALKVLNQALYIDPRNPKILILKANCFIEMNQFSEALKILDYIDYITPNLPASLYDRLVVYTYLNKIKEADLLMEQLAQLDQQAYQAALSFKQRRNEALQSSLSPKTREKGKYEELQQQSN
ncbi:MAG: O-antigen ligase family protein [Candidatus Bruticola sp.]